MSNHENTKTKFIKKIREHEQLKQNNQDIVVKILYCEKLKDDIIVGKKEKLKERMAKAEEK